MPALRLVRLASRPLERFLRIEAASGILLVAVAVIALLWANGEAASAYFGLRELHIGLVLDQLTVTRSIEWVVNDILMTIFFFVVGMEIRREINHGELSEWRRAALPVAAAIGGMVAPAGLYLLLADGPQTHDGWGVPMATDIAFALGVMALLGKRVPPALRVLLLALAVIDDLGAILVIALFYSDGIQLAGLIVGGLGIAGVFALQKIGVRTASVYLIPGGIAWLGVYNAGLHPTIAGVIIGLVTPVRAWLPSDLMAREITENTREFERLSAEASPDPHALAHVLRKIESARREAISPAERLIDVLHPWVAYAIMPVFALANAGVALGSVAMEGEALRAAGGVFAGLLLGKPLGVLLACALAVKSGLATLPRGVGFRELLVLGFAAGIGFTMALFIGQLAFADPSLLGAAKLGILAASGAAAVAALAAGFALLRVPGAHVADSGIAQSADEAESSTVS